MLSFLKFDRNHSQAQAKPREPEPPGDEGEDDDSYINTFVENGLRLHDELMVNHEAIAAARSEFIDEFHRKRQI